MTTKIYLSVDPRVTRRILDCGQLWATGNGFSPVFIFIYLFIYLWKVPCSLSMSQKNMQQLLLLSYTFVHVFVNILIRVIKQNQTNCFFKKRTIAGNNSFVTRQAFPFNHVLGRQLCNSSAKISNGHLTCSRDTRGKHLESQGAVIRTMSNSRWKENNLIVLTWQSLPHFFKRCLMFFVVGDVENDKLSALMTSIFSLKRWLVSYKMCYYCG